jgi:hypothetical protein
MYSEPDPIGGEPSLAVTTQLKYYDVTRVATGESLASGCIAVGYGKEFVGYPDFPVQKGEAYNVSLHGGSRAGNIMSFEDGEAACLSGPDNTKRDFQDRRCIRSLRTTDSLLASDILDASGAVVARSNSVTQVLVEGVVERYTLVSQDSGVVQLDIGNPPCEQPIIYREFSVTVTESD